MPRIKLNMAGLLGRSPAHAPAEGSPEQPAAFPDDFNLTRRQMLKATGAAFVGLSPAVGTLGATLQGPFEFAAADGRAAFKLGGRERWVIDVRRFGGKPVLKVERGEQVISLELAGALYPGTSLSADLACVIRRHLSGWRMGLRLALGGFSCEVPFEEWLSGAAAAASRASLDAQACELGAAGSLRFRGDARAEFSPDWLLTLAGAGVGLVSGLGAEIISDSVALSLSGPERPSLTSRPRAKRTLITLRRGGRGWPLEPASDAAGGWRLVTTDHTFDAIHVEAGESARGAAGRALVAESGAGGGGALFHPSPHLTDAEGGPFALPLRGARYAVAFDPAGDESALVAEFSREPVWLRHRGVRLQLGHAADVQPFELTCLDGRLESLRCSPALLSIDAPLRGAVVEAVRGAAAAGLLSFELAAAGRARGRRERASHPSSHGQLHIGELASGQEGVSLSQPLDGFAVSVLRPEDMLALTFEFRNLSLVESIGNTEGTAVARRKLKRTKQGEPAFVVVRFPPQHVAEEVFGEEAKDPSPIIGRRSVPRFIAARFRGPKDGKDELVVPIRGRLSGESQLAFRVPASVQEIPYTLESLLGWDRFELQVAQNALPPPLLKDNKVPQTLSGEPEWDAGDEQAALKAIAERPLTAIEVPYKLVLSPHNAAGWAHARAAVTHGDRTELWHTRLGVRRPDGTPESAGHPDAVDERDDYYRTLRAILARGGEEEDPFALSLTPPQRSNIAKESSRRQNPNDDFGPRVVRANRLMLTALGAWLDAHYEPPSDALVAIAEWRHRATMGRDHYVRVAENGFLFPFGHRAVLVSVTERKFRKITGDTGPGASQQGQVGAFLFKRKFVVVRQPLKSYGGASAVASEGVFADPLVPFAGTESVSRMFPFKSVRITTLVTPNLKPSDGINFLRVETDQGAQNFLFHLIGEDADGRRSEFTAPLIFIPLGAGIGDLEKFQSFYAQSGEARRRAFDGQKVALAPSAAGDEGATSFETAAITFGSFVAKTANVVGSDGPQQFIPIVAESAVRIQSVEHLIGSGQQPAVRYHAEYLRAGLSEGGNQSEVFLKLSDAPVALDFAGKADRAGGLATPNFKIDGLSRKFGPVADADKLAAKNFNPSSFFDTKNAKLLGGIGLHEIISEATDAATFDAAFSSPSGNDPIPKLLNTVVTGAGGAPVANKTELWWQPPVKRDPLNFFQPDEKNAQKCLTLRATLLTPLDGSAPTYEAAGSLSKFDLSFFGLVLVHFDSFDFTVRTGKKLDVSVLLRKDLPVSFGGPLAFMNILAAILPPDGFSDPPSLDISPGGVTVGYSLALPSIEAGAWGIRDLSVSAALTVPFIGDPARLRFAFGEKQSPFQVVVYGVTGGAFFALHVGLGGVERVEAAFELGGSLGLNLGVASGSVVAMIGIYLSMETGGPNKNQVLLAGYVRLGGAVSVLGLVTVSVEYYLQLGYLFDSCKLRGEASMTVRVKVLFFSKKVSLRVEREFDPPKVPLDFGPSGLLNKCPPELVMLPPGAPAAATPAHLADAGAWERYCAAFA